MKILNAVGMKKAAVLVCAVFILAAMACWSAGNAAEKPVRVAYLQNDIHHLPFWVARDMGFLARQGANVEVAGVFRSGPDIMSAFAAGALDMAYVGVAPATAAVANGTADVVVLSQSNAEGSALVVASNGRHLVKTVKDLEGKSVAIPGLSTVQDFLLKESLTKQGVRLDRVKFLVVKPPEMISALRNGDVDAFIAWEPYPAKASQMGVGRTLVSSGEMWPGHPCCVVVADAKFLASHPDQVNAVLRAHRQAVEWIGKNRDKAVDIAVKYTGMDEKTIRSAMKTVHYNPTLDADGVRRYARFLTGLGYIRIKDVDGFIGKFVRQESAAQRAGR
ncbi:ABC transporter substrate-binding protein [Geomonas subterranea]|uniref:ABC transporter substrate-binding protein n=1 Tax=Geomonas subterranea TaxID=2847989 RepID=A0ABX8LL87_9BACT|nr:ABC transporter substrate-binding protein [Geomonas subterranea]QXE92647.1 ABC transporter substrate-binding protein [Geomonas subterranea]QXM09254.1 ABC transporter substrate-binding protein [Geomonas subterranea]